MSEQQPTGKSLGNGVATGQPQEEIEITGTVTSIVFRNEDNHFVIARFEPEDGRRSQITILGTLPGAIVGQRYRVKAKRQRHPRFGIQYAVIESTPLVPTTLEGMKLYLGSGLIRGIGEVYAERIVKHFGADTFRVLDEEPERLAEVPGIGQQRMQMIRDAWQSQTAVREIMMFLVEHGVSSTYAMKIYKQYGNQTLEILRQNPYQLADDIHGIGFRKADQIAQKIGVASDEPARIESGIKYVLYQAAEQGHLYLPEDEVVQESVRLLEVAEELVRQVMADLKKVGHIIDDKGRLYLSAYFRLETELAIRLARLLRSPCQPIDVVKALQETANLRRLTGIEYSGEQREALFKALREKVFVLTGGPGTGKTTLVKGMIQIFEYYGLRVYLAAPTGRAAKRLTETTGKNAQTIHRLLKYESGTREFSRNTRNPLPAQVVIVDEMSMVDCFLAHRLTAALPLECRLILVGDADQLPSVGAGNVLHDLIQSGVVPAMKLKEIFRQARDSQIVVNAHRINQGLAPDLTRRSQAGSGEHPPKSGPFKPKDDYGDFLFVEETDEEAICRLVVDLVTEKLPQRYGYHPLYDIQILTPMYRGTLGADHLNELLQKELTSGEPALQRGKFFLRVNDRVMQVRNNYEKMVFNGDIGFVKSIDTEDQKVVVAFENFVTYEAHELDELVLAYAITVHKSQGSEYPVVILPLTTQHYMMLQRNLLYTAFTRAKELLILIGSRKALHLAVKNDRPRQRNTALAERLRAALKTENHGESPD